MTTEQLKSEVERGNMDALPAYAIALGLEAASFTRDARPDELKASIREALYYLRLGETGRATEILNQALSS